MGYFDVFDYDDLENHVDSWIKQNEAEIEKIGSVSFQKVKKDLKKDYQNETNA